MKEIVLQYLLHNTGTEGRYNGGGEEPSIIVFDRSEDCEKESFLTSIAGEIETLLKGAAAPQNAASDQDMIQFILDIDWMSTKDFCDKYNIPPPYFTGDVESSANQFLRIDAVKHKLIVEHAKKLRRNAAGNVPPETKEEEKKSQIKNAPIESSYGLNGQIIDLLENCLLPQNMECDGAHCHGCWKDIVREAIGKLKLQRAPTGPADFDLVLEGFIQNERALLHSPQFMNKDILKRKISTLLLIREAYRLHIRKETLSIELPSTCISVTGKCGIVGACQLCSTAGDKQENGLDSKAAADEIANEIRYLQKSMEVAHQWDKQFIIDVVKKSISKVQQFVGNP